MQVLPRLGVFCLSPAADTNTVRLISRRAPDVLVHWFFHGITSNAFEISFLFMYCDRGKCIVASLPNEMTEMRFRDGPTGISFRRSLMKSSIERQPLDPTLPLESNITAISNWPQSVNIPSEFSPKCEFLSIRNLLLHSGDFFKSYGILRYNGTILVSLIFTWISFLCSWWNRCGLGKRSGYIRGRSLRLRIRLRLRLWLRHWVPRSWNEHIKH